MRHTLKKFCCAHLSRTSQNNSAQAWKCVEILGQLEDRVTDQQERYKRGAVAQNLQDIQLAHNRSATGSRLLRRVV